MMFNEYFDNAILVCCKKDEEFRSVHKAFVSNLPQPVISKCNKIKDFEKEVDGNYYELRLIEEGIEFSVDYYNFYEKLLNISKITPKMLQAIQKCSRAENKFISGPLGLLSYCQVYDQGDGNTKKIEYVFGLVNVNNKINLRSQLIINNKVLKDKIFMLNKEEVESLVYRKTNKR